MRRSCAWCSSSVSMKCSINVTSWQAWRSSGGRDHSSSSWWQSTFSWRHMLASCPPQNVSVLQLIVTASRVFLTISWIHTRCKSSMEKTSGENVWITQIRYQKYALLGLCILNMHSSVSSPKCFSIELMPLVWTQF